MKKGYVYLLEDFRNYERSFKIGFTRNPVEKRVKQLQTGNSKDINIVATYETLYYKELERYLHFNYKQNHVRGEWFDLDDEKALQFVEICKAFERKIIFLKENNSFY